MAQAQTNPFLQSPYDKVGLDYTAALLPGQQATQAAPEVPTIAAAPLPTPAPQPAPAPRATTPSSDLLPPSDLRPIFEASAREFNVPVNVLMALGQQESRYDARAIGQPTQVGRAKGLMQYTDDTAKRLGINQFDPAQVIPAAAKQLRERLDKGESMADAVRGHFAGPDRSQWGPKTAAYGDEVLAKAGQIGDALYAGAPTTPEAPNANASLQAQLEAEAPGRYKVLTEVEAANLRGQQDQAAQNAFSPALPRDQYERMFRKMNPGATDDAIAQVMGAYDAQQKATTEAKGNAVQDRFAALQSPDALFQQRLNAKLQAKSAGGVVPKLPAAGTVTPKDLPIIDPGAADRETGFDAAANYLGHSTKSGLYDLAGAGARILDSINPFTLSPEDAAVLYKDNPAKLKALQDNSTAMILSRFANRMADNADESMANISARAKRDYGNLEYATIDPEKSALKAPTKVIGDAIRSLPTSAALAVSVFFTRGAALQAERQALAQGLSKDMARQAAIQAGAKAMATTGAASEGAVGYAQQVNQSTQELQKLPLAELAKSPQYQALLADGYTPETARARLIAQTAEDAGKLAGIADAAVNKFGGQFLGKILTEGGKLIPRIMKGAANEAMTETTQSALEQLGQNVATQQHINPNQDLTQGVGEAAVAGGVVGGLMGGAAAGAGGRGNHATPEQQVADAIQQQTAALQANPQSIDAAARAALNPNQGAISPAETRLPAPSHAPSTAPGLLTRAVEDASVTKQPDRVTATMADGTQESGQLTGYQEDAQGNFVAQILGDDGQVHTVDSASGITLAPEAAPAAGPLTTAMDEGAAAHAAEQPQTAPQNIPENIPAVGTQAAPEPIAVPERPVEVPLASMDLPALQERLTYIQEQAKRSGGMTRPMVDARNAVQREIKQRKQEAARAPNTTATVAGPGLDTGAGRGAVPAGRTGATEPGGLVPAGVVRERGGADAIAAIPAGGEQGAANPSTATEAANAQPALTGYPTDLAARQARKELGLGKSHQVIERAPGQFDIVSQAAKVAKVKPEPKQAPRRSADKLAAAEAKTAKQEAAIAHAKASTEKRQHGGLAGENLPGAKESLQETLRTHPDIASPDGSYHAPAWNELQNGFAYRQYVANGVAYQEVRAPRRGNVEPPVLIRGLQENGKTFGEREATGRLSDVLSGSAFSDFEQYFNQGKKGISHESTQEKTSQAKQTIPAQAGQEAAAANDVLTGAPNADQIAQQESLPEERGNGGQGRQKAEPSRSNRVQRAARGAEKQAQPKQVKSEPRRKKAKEPALSVTGGAQSAIDRAMADKTDTTVQVPGIGEVTLPYGDAKSGLAHIAKRRGAAFLPRVANLLEHGKVFTKDGQEGRVFLGHGADEAVLSLTRDGAGGPWLLSAYEKYPDLHEAKRSEVAPATMPAGQYFTKDNLQANLTSKGILGQVIAAMIDKGVIVLHGGPNKLPQGIGRRVKGVQAVTLPDGTIHMVASNLTPQTALPVLLHEMFHQGGEALIGSKEWGNLQGRLGSLYRQSEASSGKAREFFDRARARVEAARAKGAVSRAMQVEEFGAYAIEEYEKDPRNLPQAIRKWVEDLIGMVKTWAVQRFGKQLGAVTPAQLAAMARLALLDHAAQRRGQIFGKAGELFSFDDSYRDEHRAPGREDAAPLSDLTGEGTIYPDHVYSANGPRYYGTGQSYDKEAFRIANSVRGKPDAEVTIYGAVPSDVDAEINPGDWVAITKQYAIDHGDSRFDGDYKILSKKVRAGDIFTNGDSIQEWGYDPEETGAKFSVTADEIGTLAKDSTAAQGLTPPEQGKLRRLQAAVQDNQNRVKQVQERIGQMTGNPDLGKADYYGAETLRPGKTAAVLEDFRETLLAPLVEDIAKSGYSLEQVEDLLHAQHAEERNAAVARINPEFDPTSPEYGGTQGSGMNDAEAQQIIADASDKPELQALAQRARDIAKATLDLKLAYGLMKPADYELLSTQYSHYVPLKGDGEYGPKVKRAMGHGEREEHILSNIARDYEQATVAGEKNLARQSLLQMVLKYPDDKLWTARVPPRGKYVAGKSYSVQRNGKSEAVFSSLPQVNAFLEAKGAEAANYEVLDNAGERVVEFTKPLQDNEVLVYVNGDPVRLQFHDETLAQQLRPLNGGQLHPILEKMRAVNRYLSGIYTGYNPAFIFKNAMRDALTGTINMTANQGAGVASKAWGNYPNALQAMGRWAATRKAPDSAMGRWLEEYRQHGGKTGASWMADLENQGKSIQATFDQARGLLETAKTGSAKRTAAVAWRNSVGKLAHVIEVGNQATENALRLALYATLREQGQSPAKAAQAAKTVTVDFDRKGSQTSALGALYLFLNPAIQGTANAFKALAKGEHRLQAWAALGGLASLGALAAGRGMDDDKDRWLGQSWEERTKNFRMKIGSHELVLPVSQEFAPFYAAGVAGAEALRGEKPMTSAARLFSSMVDAYFPLQGAFKAESDNRLADVAQAAVPTLVKPLVETAFNRNSFGSQIVPENPQTKDRADTQKMYRGTKGTPYDTAAQTIAKLGGGKYENDWSKVSPETLKYLWRTYTGGLGAFITDSAGVANIALRDPGSLDSGDVPIVKDFIKDENAKPLANRYRNLAKEAQGAITEWRDIKKAGDGDAAELFGADQTKLQLAGMGKLIAQVNKAAAALAERKVDINADPSMSLAEKRAALKAIEAEEAELYRGAIGAFGQ